LLNASTKVFHHEYNVVDFNRRKFTRKTIIKMKKISYFPCHENIVLNVESKASICSHEPIMGLLRKKLSKIEGGFNIELQAKCLILPNQIMS